jgi:predicted CopG family antitoxin
MAHKTLTISEEAYNALARLKSKDESFTKVILRLAHQKSKGSFLDYVKSISPDPGLADSIERVLEKRKYIRIGQRRE